MGLAEAGIRDLVEAHYDSLYRYAFRLSGSAADAEDLTQDAFGKAIARHAQLRDATKARGWLFRILRNDYLHRVRDDKRRKVVSLDSVGELPAEPPDVPPDIDPAKLQEVLDELDEIPVCVGYSRGGVQTVEMPATNRGLEEIEPVYEMLPGWKRQTRGTSRFEDLPEEAKKYLAFLEKHTGVEVGCVSTGPERTETIVLKGSRLAKLFGE